MSGQRGHRISSSFSYDTVGEPDEWIQLDQPQQKAKVWPLYPHDLDDTAGATRRSDPVGRWVAHKLVAAMHDYPTSRRAGLDLSPCHVHLHEPHGMD